MCKLLEILVKWIVNLTMKAKQEEKNWKDFVNDSICNAGILASYA